MAILPGPARAFATVAPITLFVATSGSDANDGLTSGSALLTIQAAINKVPRIVEHQVTINIAAGTYTGNVILTTHVIKSTAAGFAFVGVSAVPTLASGLTSGVVASGVADSGATPASLTVAGAGWTAGDLKGRWVSLNGSANWRLITDNTATTATLSGSTAPVAGNTFAILVPGTVVAPTSGIGFRVRNEGSGSVASNILTFRTMAFVGSGASACLGHYGGYVAATECSFVGGNTVGAFAVTSYLGYLNLLRCYIANGGATGGSGLSWNGNTGGIVQDCYIRLDTAASYGMFIANCVKSDCAGTWVERTVTGTAPLVQLQVSQIQAQTPGLRLIGAGGSVGLQVGGDDVTVYAPSWATFATLKVSGCTTAVFCTSRSQVVVRTAAYITNSGTGFTAQYGGVVRIPGANVYTTVTNEVSLDNITFFTDAAVGATVPLPIVTGAQTFSSVGKY